MSTSSQPNSDPPALSISELVRSVQWEPSSAINEYTQPRNLAKAATLFLDSGKVKEWLRCKKWNANDVHTYYLIVLVNALLNKPDPIKSFWMQWVTGCADNSTAVRSLSTQARGASLVYQAVLKSGGRALLHVDALQTNVSYGDAAENYNMNKVRLSLSHRYAEVKKRFESYSLVVESPLFSQQETTHPYHFKMIKRRCKFIQKKIADLDRFFRAENMERQLSKQRHWQKCQETVLTMAEVEGASLLAETLLAVILPEQCPFESQDCLYIHFDHSLTGNPTRMVAHKDMNLDQELASLRKPYIAQPRHSSQRHLARRLFA